jgi:dihydrofolate reductase
MIKMISAMDEKRAIWKDSKTPWNITEDLERFREQISWQVIVMWRKTFETLKNYYPESNWHPLASRNIILSKTLEIPWVEIFKEPKDIVNAVSWQSMWIIWWWKTYESFLPFADELDLTQVYWDYKWDSFFPDYEYLFDKVSEAKWNDERIVFERWIRKWKIRGSL